jgi:hypothetical protein
MSVSIYPIDLLPRIYRYGYVMPFYNISHATRTIIFHTKNQCMSPELIALIPAMTELVVVGLHFGVLLGWVGVSLVTLPLLQWVVRRREVRRRGG